MIYRGKVEDYTEMRNEVRTNPSTAYGTSAAYAVTSLNNYTTQVKAMRPKLTKHSFTFGEDEHDYTTAYKQGFVPLPRITRDTFAEETQRAIDDIRKCHFVLGHDRVQYETNTQRVLRSIEGADPADIRTQLANARNMKRELMKTSVVIGDDPHYM
jgi:hypothetical protein